MVAESQPHQPRYMTLIEGARSPSGAGNARVGLRRLAFPIGRKTKHTVKTDLQDPWQTLTTHLRLR